MHNSPVEIATEIFVPLERIGPGGVKRALTAVAASGCAIEGYAEIDGALHVLTNNLRVSSAALSAAGFAPREAEVIVLDITDRPGIAQRVYRRISDAQVHEKFSYVATGNRLVIGVNETFYSAAC